MKKLTEKQAVALLKKYAPDSRTFQLVLQHSKAVQNVALNIVAGLKKQGHKVDLELIKTAAILHDLGRFKYPPGKKDEIKHGIAGGKILRKEGLPKLARIAETHLGAGISKAEIIKLKLPLPKKDFLPQTIEEKLIAYVDNIVFGDKVGTILEVAERFEKENLPYSARQRLIKLHNEIERLRGGKEKL